MGKFISARRGSTGFTLIELMIVTGIIGILASIALPVFQKYIFEARNAEAPIIMNELLNAEVSFYMKPRSDPNGTDLLPCYLVEAEDPSFSKINPPSMYAWPTSTWFGDDQSNYITYSSGLGFTPSTTSLHFSYSVDIIPILVNGQGQSNPAPVWNNPASLCDLPTSPPSKGVSNKGGYAIHAQVPFKEMDHWLALPIGIDASGSPQSLGILNLDAWSH